MICLSKWNFQLLYLLNYVSFFYVYKIGISDSLRKNILMNCENYEVSGTASFIDHNGPKISRINKQKLVNIYI